MAEREEHSAAAELLRDRLTGGRLLSARRALRALNPPQTANLLESLPPRQRELVWEMVSPEAHGEVLLHVNDTVRTQLMRSMDIQELVAAADRLEIDDLADFVGDLPETVTQQILRVLDADDRAHLEAVLAHEPDSAGGLMNTDAVTVRPDVTLDVVQRYLRLRGELPAQTDALFVVDRYGHYLGSLPLALLLTRSPDEQVAAVMEQQRQPLPATLSETRVAQRFEEDDIVSAPVVDAQRILIGRVTVDDVIDVIRRDAERKLMSSAGLDEDEDIFAPVRGAARRRAVWLGINLVTAFLASAVVDLFQASISQLVALAVLMPIVASMGGIGGSQTLTLMVRSLALGQIGRGNTRFLLRKELAVAAINGLLWAAVVGAIAWLWFKNLPLAIVTGMAIVINQAVAALAGIYVPLVLKKIGVDPALAGGVVLTTFTDVCGFFSLLSLGTLILL